MLLVIDIESYIFRACTATKTLLQFEPRNPDVFVEAYDLKKGMGYLKEFIQTLQKKFYTDDFILVVGDRNNWRKQRYPDYKANRKEKEKPPMYDVILNRLYQDCEVVSLPNLEADDTCRIIYEDNRNYATRKVLVSIDKDFHSFPCELYDPLHDKQYVINQQEADYNLMKQIIMGDKADNIIGLEGYGEVKTKKFLDDEPRILNDVRELFREKGLLQQFITNLNLVSMVSLNRYNFDTGEVKLLD